MKFFDLTNSDGGTAHIPAERFLRIQTFDNDDQEATVQVIFQDREAQKPFVVFIYVKKGHEIKVTNIIKNALSAAGDSPVTIKPNNAEITAVDF